LGFLVEIGWLHLMHLKIETGRKHWNLFNE
jgi:hypothetical protein